MPRGRRGGGTTWWRAILDDIAGNSVGRVFDRDVDNPMHDPINVTAVTVEFT
jgi:hypothetical protein